MDTRNKAALEKLGAFQSKKPLPGTISLGKDPEKAMATLQQLREFALAHQNQPEPVRYEGPPPADYNAFPTAEQNAEKAYANNARQPTSFTRDLRPDQYVSNVKGQAADQTVNPDAILHPKMSSRQAAASAELDKLAGGVKAMKEAPAAVKPEYVPPPMQEQQVAAREENFYDWAKRNGHLDV